MGLVHIEYKVRILYYIHPKSERKAEKKKINEFRKEELKNVGKRNKRFNLKVQFKKSRVFKNEI